MARDEQGQMARIEQITPDTIADAARLLREGGLVAFPTETVYGLGANAADEQALLRIFEAKGRPRFNPLIVHVRDTEHAEMFAVFDALALRLAQTFWPGPLTLVLPRRFAARLSPLASAGLDTVALRAPAHPVARALLVRIPDSPSRRRARTAPAPSAPPRPHMSRRVSAMPSTLSWMQAQRRSASNPTIVGFSAKGPVLLRPGALERDAIEAVIGELHRYDGAAVSSPGQLRSHYSPQTPIRLNAQNVRDDEALLAFGPDAPANARVTRNLSQPGDLREAAANLFAMLHQLDAARCACIAVMPVPEHGLGEAINDRLRRAAAPKDT